MRFNHLFVLLFLTACGTQKNTNEYVEFNKNRNTHCQFRFDEGEFYAYAKPNTVTTYFGKVYERNHLEAVFAASAQSTVDYLESQTQVRVFKNIYGSQGCAFFDSLNPAPDEFVRVWRDHQGSVDDGEILGIYLPENNPFTSKSPDSLVVRVDADRRILLHEFMHHLFEIVDRRKGRPDEKVRAEYESSVEKSKLLAGQFDKSRPKETEIVLKQFLELKLSQYQLLDELMLSRALEEITIEMDMLDSLDKFYFMPKDPQSSKDYIVYSANHAVTAYDQKINEAEELKILLRDFRDAGIKVNEDPLDKIISDATKRKLEILNIIRRLESISPLLLLSYVRPNEEIIPNSRKFFVCTKGARYF